MFPFKPNPSYVPGGVQNFWIRSEDMKDAIKPGDSSSPGGGTKKVDALETKIGGWEKPSTKRETFLVKSIFGAMENFNSL